MYVVCHTYTFMKKSEGKKTERLNLRMSKEQYRKLKRIAKSLDFNIAQTVRHLIHTWRDK